MRLMKARDIVFELDGTLIDSAPSTLGSMQATEKSYCLRCAGLGEAHSHCQKSRNYYLRD